MNTKNSLVKRSKLPKQGGPAVTAWVERLASIAVEGKRQLGLGCVMQTRDRAAYVTCAELQLIAPETAPLLAVMLLGCRNDQFPLMVTVGESTTLLTVDMPQDKEATR